MSKLISVGLRALSAVSPALAARVAARMWFGIPRPRASPEAERFLATGTRFDVDVNGARVVAWRWGTGPTILLMHGWGGSASQLGSFIEPLTGAGFQVIAFDAPSHGTSGPGKLGPRQATLFDFSDSLVAVSRQAGDIAGVVAHSGGCAAAAWALVNHASWQPARMVFIAPFGSASRYMGVFQRALGLSDAAMDRFRQNTERQFQFRWADFEVPAMVERVKIPPPLLVIHDRGDRETAWEDGAAIAERWPSATLRTTNGLGHNRILRDADTVDAAVRFLGLTR